MFVALSPTNLLNLSEVRRIYVSGTQIFWHYIHDPEEKKYFNYETEQEAQFIFNKIKERLQV